jgi:hypothetical protein
MKAQHLAVSFAIMAIGFGFGNWVSENKYKDFVEVHVTKSGSFILSKGRIFTMQEMITTDQYTGLPHKQ